jgi:inhibitor of Bruton tyrosine kinase
VQHRTPLELAAEELRAHLHFSKPGDVYTWGSGANYQLGTGSTENHTLPVRLEAFQSEAVVEVSAAKFHSCVVTRDGQLYTWGWGRGGRLGHAGFDVDAQQKANIMAQIHPRAVASLARHRVVAVAAAKHHTLACSADGHVFAWGSNKRGQLGITGVDSVHTPRRLGNFKHEIVAVAAANKHSAGLSASGRLYTWGDNTQGQLGYGTFGKAFNATPRIVESVKDRQIAAMSLSKRHSVVLTRDGDVLTWGHKTLPPKKVSLHGCRDTARSAKALRLLASHERRDSASRTRGSAAGGSVVPRTNAGSSTGQPRPRIHFHRDAADVVNPRVVAIAAGAAHTSMLTASGVVLTYNSTDPALAAQEVEGVLGRLCVVKIAAGKTRSVAVTDTGEAYAWEAVTQPKARGACSRRLAQCHVPMHAQPFPAQLLAYDAKLAVCDMMLLCRCWACVSACTGRRSPAHRCLPRRSAQRAHASSGVDPAGARARPAPHRGDRCGREALGRAAGLLGAQPAKEP